MMIRDDQGYGLGNTNMYGVNEQRGLWNSPRKNGWRNGRDPGKSRRVSLRNQDGRIFQGEESDQQCQVQKKVHRQLRAQNHSLNVEHGDYFRPKLTGENKMKMTEG